MSSGRRRPERSDGITVFTVAVARAWGTRPPSTELAGESPSRAAPSLRTRSASFGPFRRRPAHSLLADLGINPPPLRPGWGRLHMSAPTSVARSF